MENSRRCETCNTDVHRATHAKHSRSKKHLENEKQNEMIIPEEQAPIKRKSKKYITLKH